MSRRSGFVPIMQCTLHSRLRTFPARAWRLALFVFVATLWVVAPSGARAALTVDLWESFPDNQGENGFYAFGYSATAGYWPLDGCGTRHFCRPGGSWSNPHVFRSDDVNGWLGQPWIGLMPSGTVSNAGSPEDGVLSWIVPESGFYRISGAFYVYPDSGNGVDIYVRQNDTALFASYLSPGATMDFHVALVRLSANDRLSFGAGAHNDAWFSELNDWPFVNGRIEFVAGFSDVSKLGFAPKYDYVLQAGTPLSSELLLANTADVPRSATLEILSPHPELAVSFTSGASVTLAPGATTSVPLQFSSSTAPAVYDDLLLKATLDDGTVLYSSLKVTVLQPDAPSTPNLTVAASGIQVTDSGTTGTATVTAQVSNSGLADAENVFVRFYEFGNVVGEAFIPFLAADEVETVTIPIGASGVGNHLIEVVVDPDNAIPEMSEDDNQASRMLQIGTSEPVQGGILLTGSLPSTVLAGSVFGVSGDAVYDIYVGGVRYLDYAVKGGAIQMTVSDSAGKAWSYGDVHTDINGWFAKYLQAPAADGIYKVAVTVTDKTFVAKREFVFRVVQPPTEERPLFTPAPVAWGAGHYEPVTGTWVWVSPPSVPVPSSDLRVYSDGIYFSSDRPAENQEITVAAEILFWASTTAQRAQNVPINIYVTYPGAPKQLIEQVILSSISPASPDFGSRYVFTSWKNNGPGIYLIQAEIDPSYADHFKLNNAATRAIIVGTLATHAGVVSGHVTDIWGGVPNAMLEVVDASGASLGGAVSDVEGFYVIADIPPGPVQVRILPPLGYQPDASAKSTTVEDQTVSTVDFSLLAAPTNSPPDCKCQDVVVTTDAGSCAGTASVDVGSSDPDGNLVGCTQNPPGPYGAGTTDVLLTCKDSDQATCSCTARVVVNDISPPTITCPSSRVVQLADGLSNVQYLPSASDNCQPPAVECQPAPLALAAGSNHVTCTATDASHNAASCGFDVYVNTAPTAVCTPMTVSVNAECRAAAAIGAGSNDSDSEAITCVQNPAVDELLSLGEHDVGLSCTDAHGGTASCSSRVTVVDSTPPSIQCPLNQILECDVTSSGLAFAVASTDNCTVASSGCAFPSGSVFPPGSTVNQCTTVDASGNASSCSFTVQVKDSVPPAVVTRDEPLELWPVDNRMHEFSLSDCITQVSDACDGTLTASTAATITAISSDEEVDERTNRCKHGSDDPTKDIIVTGPSTARLRAERNDRGTGRVYRVYFEVSDAAGNTAPGSCEVVVPREPIKHCRPKRKACAYYVSVGHRFDHGAWARHSGCRVMR